LQADAEVVPLWSSNLVAKTLNELIEFEPYLPCTSFAKNAPKSVAFVDWLRFSVRPNYA
jgi:hypothetical protein